MKYNIATFFKLVIVGFIFCNPILVIAQEHELQTQDFIKLNTDADDVDDNDVSAKDLQAFLNPRRLHLHSSTALIMDLDAGKVLYAKGADKVMPIASVTKLMTAMVTLDKKLNLNEEIQITRNDRDKLRGSHSRLSYGTILTRRDMLEIMLAASENRASKALSRTYPGGRKAFIAAMNAKAKVLGMKNSFFKDASGLHSENASTARDLVKMVLAAYKYPLIRKFTTTGMGYVTDRRSGWKVGFMNTNRLVRRKSWDINVSKTGYIADAGYCLVMHTDINHRPTAIILLHSWGKLSKFGDSNRIRHWLERAEKRAEKTLATL